MKVACDSKEEQVRRRELRKKLDCISCEIELRNMGEASDCWIDEDWESSYQS